MKAPVRNEFVRLIGNIIQQNVPTDVYEFLEEKVAAIREEKGSSQLNLTFVTIPRKAGRGIVNVPEDLKTTIEDLQPGFSLQGWTIDRLCRLWLLMHLDSSDKTTYCSRIENLFKAAEMNELAALYSSLFVFEYPGEWQARCAEGIRSNIGIVLEAIMYNNAYPVEYLSDQQWNQLVLKAFFTDKNINRIIGIDERANKALASTLVDYAKERWAAHRSVNPQLWRLVAKFIDPSNFIYIEKVLESDDETERKAAALACYNSNFEPAKQLLDLKTHLKSAILQNNINWNTL